MRDYLQGLTIFYAIPSNFGPRFQYLYDIRQSQSLGTMSGNAGTAFRLFFGYVGTEGPTSTIPGGAVRPHQRFAG